MTFPDDRNAYAVDIDLSALGPGIRKVNAFNKRDDIDPVWRHADLIDRTLNFEISIRQAVPRRAELINRAEYSLGILNGGTNPQINVLCCSRQTMCGHGISADHEKFNVLLDEYG